MSQMSFWDAEHTGKRKQTPREVFLAEIERAVFSKSPVNVIDPWFPVARPGRHAYPLETIMHVLLMQNQSNPAMDEPLYEITPMRTFARLSLTKPSPDDTAFPNFWHPLEANGLALEILDRVHAYRARKGLMLKRRSIVDTTIIRSPELDEERRG